MSKQLSCILVGSVSDLSKRLQGESLAHTTAVCCQLSLNNKELTSNVLVLWGGRRISYFLHNLKNTANATYLFHYCSANLSITNNPLAAISSRVHLIPCEGQIEAIRKALAGKWKWEWKENLEAKIVLRNIYLVKAQVVGCFSGFTLEVLPFMSPHVFIIQYYREFQILSSKTLGSLEEHRPHSHSRCFQDLFSRLSQKDTGEMAFVVMTFLHVPRHDRTQSDLLKKMLIYHP